jgi:eukaryotic-like serine/threonine-protein kinase
MAKLARLPAIDSSPQAEERRRVPRLRTRYYAFLSYSHKDKELADWLHRELEKFRVPNSLAGKLTANGVVPRRLVPVFRDEQDLSAGGDLGEEIKAALAASQFLIVLCSPMAAQSRWTNEEIESFKRTRPEGCVLAAVASGEPFASEMPGREAEECFPPALRFKYDRRGHQTTKRAEPLAADFRGDGEFRRIAFLKLVAGMLGVDLDELVQREQTRRHRQIAWLAAASIGGMAVTSTLAVTAIQARDSARDQRREAEGLVAFMVGDLKDKLEPIGRLDALDGVGSRVLAYYDKQNAGELSDAGLLQRSRALSIVAQVAYLRGHYDEATRLYREAMAGTGEAVRRKPDDPQRLFDHAQNVFYVGDLARQRGEIDQAEASYREYKRLADQMVAIQPDNLKWRMEVLYANENLAIALKAKRRFAEASKLFGGVLGPLQSLTALDPSNTEYQNTYSNVLGWFADTESALGHLDTAIAARRRQIAFLGERVSGNADVSLRASVVPAHEGLGVLLSARGKTAEAIAEYRLALEGANSLLAIEPANTYWRDLATDTQLELARNFLVAGKSAEAGQQAGTACGATNALRARDRNVARWQGLQTKCLKLRARLALVAGQTGEALAFSEQALASARSERSGDPIADRYVIAAAANLLGDVRKRTGDFRGAIDAWTSGLAELPQGVVERPLEIDEHARVLERLGRANEAQPLVSKLNAIGYRRQT